MTRIPPIIQRAKQGDSHAIATLMNRHLQVQGVTAKTQLKGDCLRLMLEGNAVPNQEVMVQFIYQGMTKRLYLINHQICCKCMTAYKGLGFLNQVADG